MEIKINKLKVIVQAKNRPLILPTDFNRELRAVNLILQYKSTARISSYNNYLNGGPEGIEEACVGEMEDGAIK